MEQLIKSTTNRREGRAMAQLMKSTTNRCKGGRAMAQLKNRQHIVARGVHAIGANRIDKTSRGPKESTI